MAKKHSYHTPHSNPELVNLQNVLLENGYDLGPAGADGREGTFTEKATKAYLEQKGIHPTGNARHDMQLALNTIKAEPAVSAQPGVPAAEASDYRLPGMHAGMSTDELNKLSLETIQQQARAATAPMRTTVAPAVAPAAIPHAAVTPPVPAWPNIANSQEPLIDTPSSIEAYREQLVKNAQKALGETNANGRYGPPDLWCGGFNDVNRNNTAREFGLSGRILAAPNGSGDNLSGIKIEDHAEKMGAYHSARSGYEPKKGDTLILTRSEPGNPAARHVATVESVEPNGEIHVIAGNGNKGQVQRSQYSPSSPEIVGYVDEGKVYAQAVTREAGRQFASAAPHDMHQGSAYPSKPHALPTPARTAQLDDPARGHA